MKKIAYMAALAGVCVFGLVGCGGAETEGAQPGAQALSCEQVVQTKALQQITKQPGLTLWHSDHSQTHSLCYWSAESDQPQLSVGVITGPVDDYDRQLESYASGNEDNTVGQQSWLNQEPDGMGDYRAGFVTSNGKYSVLVSVDKFDSSVVVTPAEVHEIALAVNATLSAQ